MNLIMDEEFRDMIWAGDGGGSLGGERVDAIEISVEA